MSKLPVVLQMSAADCGAACLSMIVRYWGGDVSSQVCQAEMGGSADGVTALMIANAARQFGLEVQAFRHTPENMATAALPAIVHWQGVHFVVLESWSEKEIKVVDPALGRRRLSAEQFAVKYTGVTLTFTPTDQFKSPVAKYSRASADPFWKTYLSRVLSVPYALRLLTWLIVASLLLQLMGLLLPAATWLVVERILPSRDVNDLTLLIGIGVVAAVLSHGLVAYWRSILAIRLQQRIDSHLIPDFFNHLLGLPYRFFQLRTTGDLISRIDGNTVIREMITTGVLTGLLDGGLALLYLVILFVQAPMFGLVVTISSVAQLLLLARTSERIHEQSQLALATQAEEDSFAVQILRGIESIKGAGAEQWVLDQWRDRFDETLAASLRRGRTVAWIDSALQLLSFGTPLILLWIGVTLVQLEQLVLGQMLALVVLASSSLAPLSNLALHFHRAQQIWAHLERLADVLESEGEEKDEGGRIKDEKPLAFTGKIAVDGVAFRYRKDGAFTIKDASFTIQPGEKVAIVGASAAGKSTLLRLLLGFYPPERGEIRYDGQLLSEIGLKRLRQAVGVVLQEPFLFSGTIAQNIALHHPNISHAQIVAAAKVAAIHDEIEQMPMGYATRVGEGGSGLSGGQRQRVALARALVNRPKILFLDEATSHLDVETEERVHRGLDELDVTRLIIAHRLSTVRNADQMLKIAQGKIMKIE